ncbi:hypothetical protein CAPTEDRAFT_212627 [Capitella teleta]|uniref:Tyrosine-protein phosphatase domain-containing protein n=1 Tax=Capitella teleta TaxID=283909 RepID=R7VGR0_CAPTE|nr:hypothetical protein CAPTEDRAFT_212627 [Capitella teleta]|eukprot:ELU14880.1 hypothetical protein CAPTEDRAFT_212627 [Capitella teleta]
MGTCSECMDGLPRPNNQPDRFKWRGAACQTGNVAYNKTTKQSGVYQEFVSSKGSFRMVDFSIRVGNTSDVNEHAECAHYGEEAVKQGGDVTLDCSARGRYVSFRSEQNYTDINLVTICEFIVIGHPLTTKDCPAGSRGPFCLEPCQMGSFGVNCSSECGQCKDESCSPVNGHCSDGCQLWSVGDLCKEELCENPYYVSIYSYIGSNPAVPSLDGLTPTLREVNETSVAITWRQDPQIPQKYAEFYGYTVASAEAKPAPGATSSYDIDSPPGKGENKSALIAGVVVGVAVAIALAVAVAVLLLLCLYLSVYLVLLSSVENANHESPNENVNSGSQVLLGSSPDAEVGRHESDVKPLALDQLEAYITKKKSGQNGFKAEYQASVNRLPKSSIHPCEAGSKLKNKHKNRFADIKPFDATRVVLESDDTSHSDYINANYIFGYKDVEKHYIATQGPKASTVVDFWRLLWLEKVNRIVMVTQLVEGEKKKCELYWPCDVGTTEEFGTFAVTTVLKEEYADYAHLNAGVGRTGTMIALDYLLEQAKAEEEVDVFSCVQQMRMQRMSMVQVLEQYVFVYEALLEALKSGETAIPCTEFPRTLKNIEDHNSAAYQLMCKEFEGYRSLNAYLLTQMPLPETVSNFLHMIYSSDGIQSNVIVMLNALDEEDPEQYQFLFELAGSFMSNFETYANFK